ncbi:site-specific DNA-methyltransferase [uncultured Agrococcus sp.]|uniref:site-specific DNA-methyltransferase n=1 Tax=uncultured Agrococcus sp. TaxID=382258 RepID=UPI0025DEB3B0|nr:site-specific DNA-methyltransferase [uncultured Agrococcus sp.]
MGSKQRLQLTWYNKDKALIPTESGKYGYTWVDPTDPRYCETRPIKTFEFLSADQSSKRADAVYSPRADVEPTTDNLLIHGESGDVLEALTRVPELAEQYLGKVRLIYIDPPFNTAQTFANYEDNLEHSVWLTMMRDRLLHMKRLLSEDGSIWVHLDDVENHRMRMLLDEVFGSGNFVAQLSWEKVAGRDNRAIFSNTCDFILVYARNKSPWRSRRNLLPRPETDSLYTNPDGDPRGPWTSSDFSAQFNPAENPRHSQIYELETPSGKLLPPPPGRCWLYTQDRYHELLADNRVWFGTDGTNSPRLKRFLIEVQDGLVPKTLWDRHGVGTNDTAKKELQALFPDKNPFSTPKPERLLERIIHIASNPGDIVLDVFAGSGTSAAVAHKMGRRWVSCELVEDTFQRYTKARLTKVINDEDSGGISRSAGVRVAAEGIQLPEGLSPDEAQQLTSLLNKAVRNESGLKNSPDMKSLKRLVKTKKAPDVLNWRGGGSFFAARLAPACFDFDPELQRVLLTDAATGETLVESVAANLGYRLLLDDFVFDGQRGRSLLKVIEGVLDTSTVDALLTELREDEKLVIAATGVLDGVREQVRRKGRGSRVVHIPDDLFRYEGGAST